MAKSDYIYTDPTTYTNGETPYSLYDDDNTFKTDVINVTKWVAKRLGHPVMQLEFNSGSIYTTFEESISEYSTHINNYNIKNWMWEKYGSDSRESGSVYSETGTSEPQTPNMGLSIMLSEQYGQAVNVGGNATLYSGSITLTKNKQSYNLRTEAEYESGPNEGGGDRLEIQRIFNHGPAAITRFYDPFAGSFEQRQMLDSFGFGNVSPAVSFILRPISYDIARAQAIETNDKIRKSNYSFELVNNKLRIFPRPNNGGDKIYFQYYKRDDRVDTTRYYTTNKVTDPSNIPYKFIRYESINSSGRQWIRKFTLALSKELLGIIRSKYGSMPLPNGEVSLDGEGLKAEGREEKTQLLDELREFLESVSLTEKTKAEAEEAEANQQVLNKSPLGIYIG